MPVYTATRIYSNYYVNSLHEIFLLIGELAIRRTSFYDELIFQTNNFLQTTIYSILDQSFTVEPDKIITANQGIDKNGRYVQVTAIHK